MLTLKEYNVKLARLRGTRKLTKTMKMVSANKLRKMLAAQALAAEFERRLQTIANRLARDFDGNDHPLLAARPAARTALLVVLSTDRGLCGGFNGNLNRKAIEWIREHDAAYARIDLTVCGRRGFLYLKRRARITAHHEGFSARPTFDDARRLASEIQAAFLAHRCDEVYLARNVFHSAMSQKPVVETLLPLDPAFLGGRNVPPGQAAGAPPKEEFMISEPAGRDLLDLVIPRLLTVKLFAILLSNAAGEHGARMTAMDNATRNADDLIESYTQLRNRARQTKITRELIEIVAGAEALN